MSLEAFVIRLFIVIGVVWLTQTVLGAMGVKDPANKVIFIVVLLLGVLFLLTGGFLIR